MVHSLMFIKKLKIKNKIFYSFLTELFANIIFKLNAVVSVLETNRAAKFISNRKFC